MPNGLIARPSWLTAAQVKAIYRLYERSQDGAVNASEFFARVRPMIAGDGAAILEWCGMFLAIEPDGYTHS